MAYREVTMLEVKEVLRLWLGGTAHKLFKTASNGTPGRTGFMRVAETLRPGRDDAVVVI